MRPSPSGWCRGATIMGVASTSAIAWWQYGILLVLVLAGWNWEPVGREPPVNAFSANREVVMHSTGFIAVDPLTGQIERYTCPTVTYGAGSTTTPQITVPSVGQGISANAVIPAGNWVFVNEANGAAQYVTGNGTATVAATGFLFAAS